MPTDASSPSGSVEVSTADYLWFAELALGEMTRIVGELGDDLANRRPPLPGANSPFAILTHCLGVLEYWAGATVAGRSIERNRDSEFRASGDVASLCQHTDDAARRLRDDLSELDSWATPGSVRRNPTRPVPYSETKAAVLLHILEELFQHLGQMEITRDMLQADA
jgi:Protein of unknown function (DUF664)